jgi:hypothetical protein
MVACTVPVAFALWTGGDGGGRVLAVVVGLSAAGAGVLRMSWMIQDYAEEQGVVYRGIGRFRPKMIVVPDASATRVAGALPITGDSRH